MMEKPRHKHQDHRSWLIEDSVYFVYFIYFVATFMQSEKHCPGSRVRQSLQRWGGGEDPDQGPSCEH